MAFGLPGLCPACGVAVPRTVTTVAGVVTETYQCPRDGARTYGAHGTLLRDWAAPDMPTLRTVLGVEAAIDWL